MYSINDFQAHDRADQLLVSNRLITRFRGPRVDLHRGRSLVGRSTAGRLSAYSSECGLTKWQFTTVEPCDILRDREDGVLMAPKCVGSDAESQFNDLGLGHHRVAIFIARKTPTSFQAATRES